MKKITFLFILLVVSFGYSQNNSLPFTFEGETTEPFIEFDCADGNCPGGSNADNPDTSGINPSAKVYQYDRNVGVAWYSGFIFDTSLRTSPLVNISTDGKVFSMKVYATKAPIDVRMLLEQGAPDPGVSPSYEIVQTVNTANTWVELTFDFSSTPVADGMAYNAISIFPDWNPGNQAPEDAADTYYFDDIEAVGATPPTCDDGVQNGDETGVDCGGPDCPPCVATCDDGIQNGDETGVDCGGPDCPPCAPTSPSVAAPVPTPLQSQVINMYSNTYTTDVNVSSWRSDWSTSTYTDNVQVDGPGSECKEYIDADFVGVEFYGADAVDATSMNYFHVDVWSPNATVFRVKLVDLGNGAVEGELAYNIAQGEWVSLDIDLADFANPALVTNPANLLTVRNSLQQLIFSGQPTGTFDFYVDNVYFSEVESLSTNDFAVELGLNIYPNPTQNVWNVKTNNLNIDSIQLLDIQGRQVLDLKPNTTEASIDASSLPAGLYFARINTTAGTESIKLIKQ